MTSSTSRTQDTENPPPTSKIVPSPNGSTAPKTVETDGYLPPKETDAPRKTGRRKIPFWLPALGGVAIAGGAVAGWRWWQYMAAHPSTDNAQIQGHISPIAPRVTGTIDRVLVENGDPVKAGQPLVILDTTDYNLALQQARADLAAARADLAGSSQNVTLTGQTNQTRVNQARANLGAGQAAVSAAGTRVAQAESAVTAATAKIEQSRAAVNTATAKVVEARTEVNRLNSDYQRYRYLAEQGAIPRQQLDIATANLTNARAELQASQQEVAGARADVANNQALLEQARAAVSNARAELQQARANAVAEQGKVAETTVAGGEVRIQQAKANSDRARLEQARVKLEIARQQLGYTVIKAPVDGYVGQLTAQVGQVVQAQQPLLSVVPLNAKNLYVEANFKETELKNIRVGQRASIETDAYPGRIFPAVVSGISPATGSQFALLPPDNATGNFNKVVQWVPVRLTLPPSADPEHLLRAGLSVTATIDTTTNPNR
ncbi:HlyD family secretion protein [Pannus brasiliensis CCIBt3594]|uniref:HlyD family secretion protein n=1 Tax=Pannus brasiliensis CCIBt3594 TaxID=1427578 RepID=A0AAW9R118_9CHRO